MIEAGQGGSPQSDTGIPHLSGRYPGRVPGLPAELFFDFYDRLCVSLIIRPERREDRGIMKKIVAINCSPRTVWNTATLVKDAAEGAKEKARALGSEMV